MRLQEIISYFKGAKRTGANQYMAFCPVHEAEGKHNPSLAISEASDGKILMQCFAGCQTIHILAAVGLSFSDLFLERKKSITEDELVGKYNYTDENGKLLFWIEKTILPSGDKKFRPRHFDPNDPKKIIPNIQGVKRVLYNLPEVLKAVKEKTKIFICEGEKDCEAMKTLGFVTTTNPFGAKAAWENQFSECLKGADVIIIEDKDKPDQNGKKPGAEHTKKILMGLKDRANSIKVLKLPNRGKHPVKDAFDWINYGGTAEELNKLVEAARIYDPQSSDSSDDNKAKSFLVEFPENWDGLIYGDYVTLPNGEITFSMVANHLGQKLAEKKTCFYRGQSVDEIANNQYGVPVLQPVNAPKLVSMFDKVAKFAVFTQKKNGQLEIQPRTCSEALARIILHSSAFVEVLPPLSIIASCPVLVNRKGKLVQINGYDQESRVLARGYHIPYLPLDKAVSLLHEMLSGFKFASLADKARAIASIITPALIFGGILNGRSPVDLGEANESQTGKGYRNKLTASIYNQLVMSITQKKFGVGSLEESFNAALIKGANFISIDNVRGIIDSPAIESFLTEDIYFARIPYRSPVEIDTRRTILQLTSNKAEITKDLANRSSCCRLLKQDKDFRFKRYPEGDILAHIQANQDLYLSAVFTVIKAWFDAGMPRTEESRHSFRTWVQTLDWICQHIFNTVPIMDNHEETQERMTNPLLNWLRDIALAVQKAGKMDEWIRTSDIIDLIVDLTDIEVPGMGEHGNIVSPEVKITVNQTTGRKIGKCFQDKNALTIDNFCIKRRVIFDKETRRDVKEYLFSEVFQSDMSDRSTDAEENTKEVLIIESNRSKGADENSKDVETVRSNRSIEASEDKNEKNLLLYCSCTAPVGVSHIEADAEVKKDKSSENLDNNLAPVVPVQGGYPHKEPLFLKGNKGNNTPNIDRYCPLGTHEHRDTIGERQNLPPDPNQQENNNTDNKNINPDDEPWEVVPL